MPIKTLTGVSHIRIKKRLPIPKRQIGFPGMTVLIIGVWLFGPLLLAASEDGSGLALERTDQIAALIAQLDAQDFARRESAQRELAKLGAPAIGPLAIRSFDCSPESCWRIKKALEQICTDGDEDIFYKATGILQLRFDGGNVAMTQRLAELEKQWRIKRTSEAIRKLREKGAVIVSPFDSAQLGNGMAIMRHELIFANGRLVDFAADVSDTQVPANPPTEVRKRLTEKELKSKIKTILESDIDDNRRLVFGTAQKVDSAPDVVPMVGFRNRIRVNQILVNGRIVPNSIGGAGITIQFTGTKWNGTEDDFDLLKDIANIQEVSFSGHSPTSGSIQKIAAVSSLKKLTFENCEIKTKDLEDSDWSPGLRELEFANLNVSTDLIDSCASIKSLQVLTFNACDLKETPIGALKKLAHLRGLQFKQTEIDKTVFESLAELKQLTYVNLSVCKFKVRDYQALKKQRPELQVAYTAQAFLGVRGPVDLGTFQSDADEAGGGCPISEVITGSGAQKGGMKVGDVIKEVNGQAIERFEDLRLHIAQHEAGDTLDVVVRRSGKPVKLAIKLGPQTPELMR